MKWSPEAVDRLERAIVEGARVQVWRRGTEYMVVPRRIRSRGPSDELVGTSLDQKLAGIVAFSGAYVPFSGRGSHKFAKPPVALIHGDMDKVVDISLSRQASEALAADGFDVQLHIAPNVAHGISPDGLDFATSFLLATMAARA